MDYLCTMELPNELVTFSFSEHQFTYVVTYLESSAVINISCIHDEEYYKWQFTTDSEIVTSETSMTASRRMFVGMKPVEIYELLYLYSTQELHSFYTFEFPRKIKDPDTDLEIRLITRLPHLKSDESMDVKQFILRPVNIIDRDRFDHKLANLKKHIDTRCDELQDHLARQDVTIKNMESKLSNFIDMMDKRIEYENRKSMSEIMKELILQKNESVRQAEEVQRFKSLITKMVQSHATDPNSKVEGVTYDL